MREILWVFDPVTTEGSLYLVEQQGDQRFICEPDPAMDGRITCRAIDSARENRPLLRLSNMQLWREIGAKLAECGFAPKDSHTPQVERHLADALAVRDRLLALVEKRR